MQNTINFTATSIPSTECAIKILHLSCHRRRRKTLSFLRAVLRAGPSPIPKRQAIVNFRIHLHLIIPTKSCRCVFASQLPQCTFIFVLISVRHGLRSLLWLFWAPWQPSRTSFGLEWVEVKVDFVDEDSWSWNWVQGQITRVEGDWCKWSSF